MGFLGDVVDFVWAISQVFVWLAQHRSSSTRDSRLPRGRPRVSHLHRERPGWARL